MLRLKKGGKSSAKLRIVRYPLGIAAAVVLLDVALHQPIEKVLQNAIHHQEASKVFMLRVKRPKGGIFLVHYSDVMQFGKHQEVICRVAFGDVDIRQDLEPSSNDIVRAVGQRADAMKVTLSGDNDLGVRMISNEEQAVSQSGITQWVADLNPHKPGEFKMNISAAFLKPAGHTGRMAADWYDQSKDIRVEGALKYDALAFWRKVSSEGLTAATSAFVTIVVTLGLRKAGIKKAPDA